MANCWNKTGTWTNVKAKNFLFYPAQAISKRADEGNNHFWCIYVESAYIQDTLTDHYADF